MIDSLLSRQEKVWSGPVTSELPNRAKSQSDPSLLDLLVSSSYSLSPLLPSPSIASYPPILFFALLSFLLFIFSYSFDASRSSACCVWHTSAVDSDILSLKSNCRKKRRKKEAATQVSLLLITHHSRTRQRLRGHHWLSLPAYSCQSIQVVQPLDWSVPPLSPQSRILPRAVAVGLLGVSLLKRYLLFGYPLRRLEFASDLHLFHFENTAFLFVDIGCRSV